MNHLSPLETAHSCAQKLHAVSDLVTQSSTGDDTLHLVKSDPLAHLLNTIIEQLEAALEALDREKSASHLRGV